MPEIKAIGLYIFIFLHQTTTQAMCSTFSISCISLYSYIKPQLIICRRNRRTVVYLYIPTSNHNDLEINRKFFELYIFIFLHQTTTCSPSLLYPICCISLYSYIKPQLIDLTVMSRAVVYLYIPTSNHNLVLVVLPGGWVVYLYIPTSNHNLICTSILSAVVVYLYIPTSNHNSYDTFDEDSDVVYLYIPTSNHNLFVIFKIYDLLYIFIFLHQTTTVMLNLRPVMSCISLYSYIKPQQTDNGSGFYVVVYLYIPTSNHNLS